MRTIAIVLLLSSVAFGQGRGADGKHLGTIPISRVPQNLAFAGTDKSTLYVVGRGAAYRVQMLSKGFAGRPK